MIQRIKRINLLLAVVAAAALLHVFGGSTVSAFTVPAGMGDGAEADLSVTKSVRLVYPPAASAPTSTSDSENASESLRPQEPEQVVKPQPTPRQDAEAVAFASARRPSPWIAVLAVFASLVAAPLALLKLHPLGISGNLLRVSTMDDLWLTLRSTLYELLSFFGLRRKRSYWGTVYDSKSKQPLDPVVVRLISAETGKVMEESITNLEGRFGFLVQSGRFTIIAQKTHYKFPSRAVTGNTDGIYGNLYHGEVFDVQPEADVVTPNIPMDPLEFDWNQQDKLRIVKFHPKLEYASFVASQLLFWTGAAVTAAAFVLAPSVFGACMVAVYLLMIVLFVLTPSSRLWGQVISDRQPIAELLLEMSPVLIPNIVVFKAFTKQNGRFFMKVESGQYILHVKRIVNGTPLLIGTSAVTIDKEKTLNKIIRLDNLAP